MPCCAGPREIPTSPAGILWQKEETETLVAVSAAGSDIGHVCVCSEHSNPFSKVKTNGLSLWKGGCLFLLVSSQMYFSVLPILREDISNGGQSLHPPAASNPSFAVQYNEEKVVLFPEEVRTLNHTTSDLNQKMLLGAGSTVSAYTMVV